jgi:hypothetical protein
MPEPTFQSLLEKEYADLEKTLEDLRGKRAEIDQQIDQAEERFTRLRDAQAILEGKHITQRRLAKGTTEAAARRARAPRGERGKLREQIKDIVAQHPDGLAAEGINQELGATTPKDKQRIANVLSLMKNEGILTQAQRRGPYKLGAS